jgi:hypothetical protein
VTAGTGSDALAVTLAANTSTATRYATVTVAGVAVRITQAGTGCTMTVSPLAITVGSLATTAHVTVMAPSGCGWSASSPVPWVALSPTSGLGSTSVRLTFSDNASDAVRTASLMVAGQQVTVLQSRRPKPPGGLKVTN